MQNEHDTNTRIGTNDTNMKSNKSYLKRIKVTKNGKLMTRKIGQNHFNAKNRTNTTLNKRRPVAIKMTNKDRGRYLNNA